MHPFAIGWGTRQSGHHMRQLALVDMGLPLFDGLDATAIDALGLKWTEHSFRAGNTVFSQDDDSRDVLFLLSGSVLALFRTQEGHEIVFTRYAVGSCIGELSALDDQPRSLAIFAKTDVRVIRLEQKSFLRLMDDLPQFRNRVLTDLTKRIRNLTLKTLELTTFTIEQRVCSYMIRLALDNGQFVNGGVIEQAPTHVEIANSIGATREAVSRTISSLSKRAIIKPGRQRIEVVLPQALLDAI